MKLVSAFIVLCVVSRGRADCDNDIHVEGVSSSNGQVNGVYKKLYTDGCDSRDVFNHTDNNMYLYHIQGSDSLTGYWMIREEYACGDNNHNIGLVRNEDGERNPGLIQVAWQENQGGSWNIRNEIDVVCYSLPDCRYYITGVNNDSLKGYYDVYQSGNAECSSRDTYKHESRNIYLYMRWSELTNTKEYWWQVFDVLCTDAAADRAYLRNDEYTTTPANIGDPWDELDTTTGIYMQNNNVFIDCINELTTAATTPAPPTTPAPAAGGVVYTRWGRTICEGQAAIVYEGIMASAGFIQNGSGSNYLCLTSDPEWDNFMDGDDSGTGRGTIHGIEYQGSPDQIFNHTNLGGMPTFVDQNVPCSVCELESRSRVLMIPGRSSCPAGWQLEYWGYLMSENYEGNGRSSYECIDHAPEPGASGSQPSLYTGHIYHVEARCGSMPCPPYVNGREITCAMCSK